MQTQFKITEYSKHKLKMKRLYGILIVCDDFADQPSVVHTSRGGPDGGSWLVSLFVRGRHAGISTLVSTQMSKLLGPTIRTQTTFWLIWRLRNAKELFDNLLWELSALYPVKVLQQMYEIATGDRFGFLFVNLQPKSGMKEDMFWKGFEARLIPRVGSVNDGSGPGRPSASALLPSSSNGPPGPSGQVRP